MVDVHGYDVISHRSNMWYHLLSLSSNRLFAAVAFEKRNYHSGKREKICQLILDGWKEQNTQDHPNLSIAWPIPCFVSSQSAGSDNWFHPGGYAGWPELRQRHETGGGAAAAKATAIVFGAFYLGWCWVRCLWLILGRFWVWDFIVLSFEAVRLTDLTHLYFIERDSIGSQKLQPAVVWPQLLYCLWWLKLQNNKKKRVRLVQNEYYVRAICGRHLSDILPNICAHTKYRRIRLHSCLLYTSPSPRD